jgi:hypothetical protein
MIVIIQGTDILKIAHDESFFRDTATIGVRDRITETGPFQKAFV